MTLKPKKTGIAKARITIEEPILVLSGDVGGTKTRLQLTRFTQENIHIVATNTYRNKEFNSFTEITIAFLREHASDNDKPQRACFAIAGPIEKDKVQLTNLPWTLSAPVVAAQLDIPDICFINDFEAIGYGMLSLTTKDCHTLQPGRTVENSVKSVIGAGTGLGVVFMHAMQDYHYVFTSEGGHIDFAPTDDIQEALLLYLRKKFHRVSNERIVSGIGITNIYKFVRNLTINRGIEHPQLQQLAASSSNFSRQIGTYALQHRDPLALQTLDIFIRCYGSVAGNLALTTLPYGGLYLAGGVAPKLLSLMQDGRFMAAFKDKGRSSLLLAHVPVHVILNTQVGLNGAAYYAVNRTDYCSS